MNHRYIDEASVAERYLEHRLAPDEQARFEAHLLGRDGLARDGHGCDECADRLLLAQLFLDKQKTESAHSVGTSGAEAAWGDPWRSHPEDQHGGNGSDRAEAGRRNGAIDASYSVSPDPVIPNPEDPERESLFSLFAPPDTMPWTARFVAQFTPWQLALILAVAAALLLSTPTAYYLWELTQLRGAR